MFPGNPKAPLLSILIPTYNRINFLKEALDSLYQQEITRSFEVIVVDDGSQDGTWDYLLKKRESYPNFYIARHPTNLGVAEARNTLLSLTQGKYVLFLDSDDYLVEDGLNEIFKALEREKEAYLLSVYLEKKNRKKAKIFSSLEEDPLLRLKAFIDGKYSDALYVIKRSLFDGFTYQPILKIREDWIFKGKLLALNSPEVLPKPIGVIRDHPHRLRKDISLYEESLLISVDFLFKGLPEKFQSLYPYAKAKAYLELGGKYLSAQRYHRALEAFNKALESYPKLRREFKFIKKYLKAYLLGLFEKKDVQ